MKADHAMKVEALCRRYVSAMESGDLEALLAVFSEDATAVSPIFGKQPVRDFYGYVLRVTGHREMALKTICLGATEPARAAIHMAYTRTVAGGAPATIEAVDVFELTADGDRFASVTIIYDTAPVRSDFDGPKTDGLEPT